MMGDAEHTTRSVERVYGTCIFCNASLGTNESIEHFPVGERLAFDSRRGRLWAVCPSCARWNLSPIEERWEAIEECERAFRGTALRLCTDQIGLARLHDGSELVRIGDPVLPEFAAWRYGARLRSRRRTAQLMAGGGVAAAVLASATLGPTIGPAMALGALSIVIVPGITSVMGVIPVVGVLAARDWLRDERVLALVPRGKMLYTVREKHVRSTRLSVEARGGRASLELQHDGGWTTFEGTPALHHARVLLAGANRFGAPTGALRHAVAHIEEEGDAPRFLERASRLAGARTRVASVVNGWRHLGAFHLSPTERLALEMAMNEETERRALEGELYVLADAWRDAERIAVIADSLLAPQLPSE